MKRTVLAMVAKHAASHRLRHLAEDLQAFEVAMLDVKRTFVEKRFTLHSAYEQDRVCAKDLGRVLTPEQWAIYLDDARGACF